MANAPTLNDMRLRCRCGETNRIHEGANRECNLCPCDGFVWRFSPRRWFR